MFPAQKLIFPGLNLTAYDNQVNLTMGCYIRLINKKARLKPVESVTYINFYDGQ